MGYLTRFELSTRENLTFEQECEIAKDLEALIFDENKLKFDEEDYFSPIDIIFCEELKWYDHQMDMKIISIKYPNILFILEGYGEERGDMWREYHLNGKVQFEKAKFDDFDEGKLI